MARPHLEWIHSGDVTAQKVTDGPLRGLARRLLSEDVETGASTALVWTPAVWSGTPGALEGSVELFVIEGTIRVGDRPLRRLGYALLAAGSGVEADESSEFLLMTDPSRAADTPSEDLVIDGEALPWEKELHGAPAGVGVKVFRGPDDPGPITLLVGNVPHYDSGPEFHECPEEIFVLEGDVGNETVSVGPGDYLWRPEYITHGPYRSVAGLLVFLRGHGEIVARWMDDPDATPEQNRAYAEALRKGAS